MTRSASLTPDQQSGKAAFKALAKAFGGQVAVEAETGIRQQEISDYGLPNVAKFASVDLVDFLEDRTHGAAGWPHVTAWLCRRRGGLFVALPQGVDDAAGLLRAVIEMAGDMGDVSDAISEALHPGGDMGEAVSPAEARHALERLDTLDAASARLRRGLNAIVADATASKGRKGGQGA